MHSIHRLILTLSALAALGAAQETQVETRLANEQPNTVLIANSGGEIVERVRLTAEEVRQYRSMVDLLRRRFDKTDCKRVSDKCFKCDRLYCTNIQFRSGDGVN